MRIHAPLVVASIFFLVTFVAPTKAFAVIQSLDGLTVQNQTFVDDSNVTLTPSGSTHTLGWFGQLPVSRGGTGVGSFTTGSLFFFNGSTFAENNSKLFWDNTNNRLGIGTSSPTVPLEVSGSAKISGNLDVTGNITGNVEVTNVVPYTGATGNVDLGFYNITANKVTSNTDATINSINIGLGGASVPTSTSIGKGALNSLSAANNNTAVGFVALGNSTDSGEQNTAIGSQALSGNISGSINAAFGYQALQFNTTGIRNVAMGNEALRSNTTGAQNVAVGFRSMTNNTTGGSDVAIGDRSAVNLTGGANVVIGAAAANLQADGSTFLTTASNSVYIGNSVQGFNNSDFNSIVIGTGAIGAGANKTVIGSSSMTDIYFGSSDGFASTHAKKMYLGTSSVPGCIIMGDSDGSGVSYLTVNDGVLSVSTTAPSACQ